MPGYFRGGISGRISTRLARAWLGRPSSFRTLKCFRLKIQDAPAGRELALADLTAGTMIEAERTRNGKSDSARRKAGPYV